MCFSAEASFLTAAVTGLIGIATLTQVDKAREVPLAAIPLIFAAQQAVEGGLWLTLPIAPNSGLSSLLTHGFLFFSLLFWPVFAPFAAWSMEPEQMRRRAMLVCLVLGIAVAGYFLPVVTIEPHTACISGGHIAYFSGNGAPLPIGSLYLIATGVALLISSHRAVALLGWVVFLGSIVSYIFYWHAFISVWCFFASGASVVLLIHFQRARTARRVTA